MQSDAVVRLEVRGRDVEFHQHALSLCQLAYRRSHGALPQLTCARLCALDPACQGYSMVGAGPDAHGSMLMVDCLLLNVDGSMLTVDCSLFTDE